MDVPTTRPGGTIRLAGREVSRIGYGAMQLEHTDPDTAATVLRRAVELGINLLDTAAFYGDATVNAHLRRALAPYADDLVIASKVGARYVDGPVPLAPAQHPAALRAQVHRDLVTLGLDQVPVVHLRRLDRAPGIVATGDEVVPLDDQLAELLALRDEWLVGGIGLSNVDADQLCQALPAGIVSVQNVYNAVDRTEEDVLRLAGEHGVAWIPYFPLGSAFDGIATPVDDPAVQEVARRHGTSAAAVSLAWILAHAPHAAVIPGTRTLPHLEANVAAGGLRLSAEDVAAIDASAR